VYMKRPQTHCVWAKGLPEVIYLPVAHGEGKFVAKDKATLERLKQNRQIVFQYCDQSARLASYPANPNGSEENIAGICDDTGRVFGLMPHPERHLDLFQHPRWSSIKNKKEGDGLSIFRNGVDYARKNL
jgi:phosphoribosylformylglycinamidine (FGAM) synthase-like amidotransferase family enzyme